MHKFFSLWDIWLRVQLLGHTASPFLVFNGRAKLFSRGRYQQYRSASLAFGVSFYLSHSEWYVRKLKPYLIMVLICILLMANDVGHLFISLFFICITYSLKCLFISLPTVRSWRFFSYFFFPRSFIVLYFTLKSMIQSELIFV